MTSAAVTRRRPDKKSSSRCARVDSSPSPGEKNAARPPCPNSGVESLAAEVEGGHQTFIRATSRARRRWVRTGSPLLSGELKAEAEETAGGDAAPPAGRAASRLANPAGDELLITRLVNTAACTRADNTRSWSEDRPVREPRSALGSRTVRVQRRG